ncbi:hydantoinase B/oxoprolinase family protein [Actinocorallia sp. A-T 12471]|uniref:hydantoinase B/oxoprolinase family protein n=1 Tax=Actinocorallia sp. A-T 12471 TaxID=3089813 RepID=UPI0029CAD23D|nr:hydantoinase B/oxoprolinase family protein [Actinocorallia sp. A-T 12471]MDX6740629.1 hydantoinase B/oxoprolinase family protein [Actinocorallia sp. A-T 12471]
MSLTDPLDPVTAEILRANLVAITDEMKSNLRRTAYNQIIYEAQDFTVGLFDRDGDTVSVGLGLPMFVGGLSRAVKAKIAHYGHDGIEPGDILLTNDPDIMGSHLNHMIFTLPVFADGEIVAFASSMAHWMDVGGVLGGTTTDIWSEGLQVPMVKIYRRGVLNEEMLDLIAANVRFPELAMGDLRAQIAAIRTGERRVGALVERYGTRTLTQGFHDLYARGEALARKAVEQIPDGTYTAATTMDDDGVNLGVPVPIEVSVTVEGSDLTIDLSGVAPQVTGYFNSGMTAGISAAQVAFKFLTTPDAYPVNEGALRPVRVVLPPGRVVSATKPAAMRWWMTYPMTIIDCVFRALAQAVPEGTIAGHHADIGVMNLIGTDPASGRFFVFNGAAQGGGWGARAHKDGEDATICVNDGDTHNTPVEVTEAKYPSLLVERYALRADSGGPGQRRGGLGTVYDVRTEGPARLNTFVERTHSAPWGIAGGAAALPNRVSLITPDDELVSFPNGKIDSRPLAAGERVVIETGGGGGFGDPRTRPVARVLADVRAGYVSVAEARAAYGVALVAEPLAGAGEALFVRSDAETPWHLDEAETERLRGA